MTTPAYLCQFRETALALTAGVARTVDVPINGARNWLVVVKNVVDTAAPEQHQHHRKHSHGGRSYAARCLNGALET